MDTPTPSTPRTSPFFHPLPLIDTLTLASYDSPTTPTTSRPATSGHVTPTYAEPSSFYYQRNPGDFPPEIVSLIVHHLYDTLLPPLCEYPSPDPYLQLLPKPTPYSSPLFAPSPAEQARESFRNLALVDRTWGEEATKALWRVVGFGMPRAFENVLRTIEEYKSGRRIKRAERVDVSGSSGWSFDTIGGMDERGRGMEVGGDNKWSAMAGREIVGQEIPIGELVLRADEGDDHELMMRRRSFSDARIPPSAALARARAFPTPPHQGPLLLALPNRWTPSLSPSRLPRTIRHPASPSRPPPWYPPHPRTAELSRRGGGRGGQHRELVH